MIFTAKDKSGTKIVFFKDSLREAEKLVKDQGLRDVTLKDTGQFKRWADLVQKSLS